jgi:MiaB-like tRNA modifying enzyme
LNHGEARSLLKLLINSGHLIIDSPKCSDIIILFTCTVIRTTELKMLRQIQKFSNLDKPMIVSGCMAVVQQKEILDIKPDIYFLRPTRLNEAHLLIDQIIEEQNLPLAIDQNLIGKSIPDKAEIPIKAIDKIISISTGCQGQCKYCITKLARGDLKSYPENKVIQEVETALRSGKYEIRLTAQDTGCYGLDSNTNLANLISKVSAINSKHDFRIRVGMMNPDSIKKILGILIESYKHPRVFNFLHIPVQSGDDRLLKEMGRRYTTEEFMTIINKFRENLPKVSISTDIIVGYPTEDQERFHKSLELIKELQPNIVNITRFSARPGTPANKLENKLPGRVVKARSRELTKLRFDISKKLNESEIGNKYLILITEKVKAGSVLGRNDHYTPIVVKENLLLGSWVDVEIIEATESYLIGKQL